MPTETTTPPAASETPAQPPVSPELAAIRAARAQVQARTAAAETARAARAEDPAVQLAEEKLALAREKAAADLAEHELEADRLYLDACIAMGEDRVMRFRTRFGSIVFRAQSTQEMEAQEKRAAGHTAAERAAKTPAEAEVAHKNAVLAMELGFAGAVLTNKAHFERVTSQNIAIWPRLWAAQRQLIDASELAEGKVDAH